MNVNFTNETNKSTKNVCKLAVTQNDVTNNGICRNVIYFDPRVGYSLKRFYLCYF